ncbi:MAG: chlorohydrolase [Deltaproteobacteria bacterium]|nr:MAG: chlorohydrolase [Deltaproteobacteria bacterium]
MNVLLTNILLNGEHKDILITGNRFTRIAASGYIHDQYSVDKEIDGTGKAILPSLMNGHTHAAMTLLRGYADDLPLGQWLQEHIWPIEAKMTEEDIYWGTKLACLEMIRTGTTFFADMYWHLPGTVRAVQEMGIRAGLAAAFFDFGDKDKAEQAKMQIRDFHKAYASLSDRILFTLGPHAIYTVSRDSLAWVADYAERKDLRIHLHLSETREEVENCRAEHGMRPVEYLHSLGMLSPRLMACHCVWLDDHERELLAEHHVHIVHNPASNSKLVSGRFDYQALAARGINVGLGTDGCASNNNLDMFEEMKLAALLAKSVADDPTVLPAQDAFALATSNMAAMYGLECGVIQEGMLADCMLVDLDHPQLVPNHNLISNIVYSANGDCVDTVICNGQILMEGRNIPGQEDILAGFRASVERLKRG